MYLLRGIKNDINVIHSFNRLKWKFLKLFKIFFYSCLPQVRFNPLGASVPAFMLLVSGFIIMVTSIQAFMKPEQGDEAAEVYFSSFVKLINHP